MGSTIQTLSLAYLKKNAGDDNGNPLSSAVTIGVPVSKILSIQPDTSVAGCATLVTVQTSGNIPDLYYSATSVATIISTINTTA